MCIYVYDLEGRGCLLQSGSEVFTASRPALEGFCLFLQELGLSFSDGHAVTRRRRSVITAFCFFFLENGSGLTGVWMYIRHFFARRMFFVGLHRPGWNVRVAESCCDVAAWQMSHN
jgi:hypothetical protein